MSFKIGRVLSALFSLILGLFLAAIGAISLLLPFSASLRSELVQFILEGNLIFTLLGLGFLLVGFSLVIFSIFGTRKKYTSIRVGSNNVVVDQNIIQHYLTSYWEEQFPKHPIPSEFKIKKNIIQIRADFPFLPKEEQKEFLNNIKNDFNDIFRRILGYPHEVLLIASFKKK